MTAARRAAIVTPFFTDRDAVCNDVHHSARILRGRGWDARVFAVGGASEREAVHPLAEMAGFLRAPADLCYFHFSHGEPQVVAAVAALSCRRMLKFHNVTPPELFSLWCDELAEASRAGRAQMRAVAAMPWERVLADSAFNLQEVEAFVRRGTALGVLAPLHDVDELVRALPAAPAAREMPRLLTVGRIVPPKGHPFLLRVMRYLVHDLDTPAVLDVVGKPDGRLLAYRCMLDAIVCEYGLQDHVSFHGEVSRAALAERYSEAAALLIASEHEGFCVPLVEAMALGVPIVALRTTAVPETVGDAGLLWDERDPRRFALAVKALIEAPADRAWLAARGRERYAALFDNEVLERGFAAALGETPQEATS